MTTIQGLQEDVDSHARIVADLMLEGNPSAAQIALNNYAVAKASLEAALNAREAGK